MRSPKATTGFMLGGKSSVHRRNNKSMITSNIDAKLKESLVPTNATSYQPSDNRSSGFYRSEASAQKERTSQLSKHSVVKITKDQILQELNEEQTRKGEVPM